MTSLFQTFAAGHRWNLIHRCFFAKREGDAECKTVISLDFDGLRAEQDGFTACLLTFKLKKELQYFYENNKNYYFCIDIGKSV